MRNLTNPAWIKLKGTPFLFLGLLSALLLFLGQPTLKAALLLILTVWCFCRSYYSIFYVIEHYVDPGYRFSGILSAVRYFLSKK